MEAQRSLLKNNSHYGRFSSTACFSGSSFETLQLFGFVDLLIPKLLLPVQLVKCLKGELINNRLIRLHEK